MRSSTGASRGTAWAYLVVSSEQQVETLAFQERWAKETASQRGWLITETFQGVSSGRDGTRALLKKLLVRLEDKSRSERPDRVLMIRLDRLGRGLGLEALAALAQITEFGVTIHTRQDGDYAIARASDAILPLMRIDWQPNETTSCMSWCRVLVEIVLKPDQDDEALHSQRHTGGGSSSCRLRHLS